MMVLSSRCDAAVVLVIASFLGSSAIHAAERNVRANEVPRAVHETIAHKYPQATVISYTKEIEHGSVSYEVSLRSAGRTTDVGVSPEGRILIEEDRIAQKDLPPEVSRALAGSADGRGRVERIERIVEPGKDRSTRFEILVRSGEQRIELTFERDGRLIKREQIRRRP